jgi:hypothetical protein
MSPLREVRKSDKSRSRWARREQRRVKLNAEQQGALSMYLQETDFQLIGEPIEVRIEHRQLLVNGLYLHSDGEWATYPEHH